MANQEVSIIDTEEEAALKNENRLVIAGIYGDTDEKAMADRAKRTETFIRQYDYREIVPCYDCCNCIEYRRFTSSGEAYTVGRYCLLGEFQISGNGTCRSAYPRKHGRRRVIYDATNAPQGFEQGMVAVNMRRFYSKRERFKAAREESRGYRGGSSSYQRADGNREAVGSGKIPKGLGN